MRSSPPLTGMTALVVAISLVGTPSSAQERWVPSDCEQAASLQAEWEAHERREESPDARWNRHYREAFGALDEDDLLQAERSFCAALVAARGFGPRDWRFAETLDELGLVAYLRGDLPQAEAMQGAATAEMLLALGPRGEEQLVRKPGRESCRSSVATYADRLVLVLDESGRSELALQVGRAPFKALEWGYLPLDTRLAGRLDWLISEYLLAENLVAADTLAELRTAILEDG